MPLTSGAEFAGFRIVRPLGSGGMGEVYLVQHPRLPRQEALKILRRDVSADGEYRERFNREADLAGALYHPHIVGVHDRGDYDGQLWISMDYVEGADAGQLLRERFPRGMPRNEVVAIIAEVADALDYAHGRSLLHRDVKPANILLSDADSDLRRVLLADFGIARRLDETGGLTATNTTLGTINYAAPEQLTGGPIDGRADQYALAATAFHLLTGAAPQADSNPAVVISRRLTGPPPRIADVRPELAGFDSALVKAMARDAGHRFVRCRDFATALRDEEVRAGAPTMLASDPSMSSAAGPGARSPGTRQLIVALAGLGALLVVALVVVVVVLTRRAAPQAAAPLEVPSPTAPTALTAQPTSTALPTVTAATPTATTARMVLPDADAHGFVDHNGGARCSGPDRAKLIVRTAESALVVCQSDSGGLYYRGYRLSDGATLELDTVAPIGTGWVAINSSDGTRYEVSDAGLQIVQNGQVVSDESAIESAS
jgi:serine/threonine protein kinase, bacterial